MISPQQPSLNRIVIADFDALRRVELCRMVKTNGYTVIAETSEARETVKAAYSLRADLVLLDSDLPIRSGVEVAAILVRKKIAPVILLADRTSPNLVREASLAGVQSILTIPLREASLVPAMEMAHSVWETTRRAEQRLQNLRCREQTRDIVDCAKRLLMTSRDMTEGQAYRYLQTQSMRTRRPMRIVAESHLIAHGAVHAETTYPSDLQENSHEASAYDCE